MFDPRDPRWPISASSPQVSRHLGGLSEIADDYDLILCDVWGVVHNGLAHHATAVDAIRRFRNAGGCVVLITNAPNPAKRVIQRLDALHVPHDAYDAIVTSGDITIDMIVARGDVALHYVGPPGETYILRHLEEVTGRAPRLVDIEAADLVVCTGPVDAFNERPADYDARLARMQARGLAFICANPDIVVQFGNKLMFCAGAIAERYAAQGGTVLYAGKPHPAIYAGALARAEALRGAPVAPARILAIGDAMHTDMQGAARAGHASLFVSSGIHAEELHGAEAATPLDVAAFERFCEAGGLRPTAVMPQLKW